MVFSVILISDGASQERAAAAVALGPPYIEAACGYAQMLDKTGWQVIDRVDLSPAFANSTRKLVDEWKKKQSRVRHLVGDEDFDEYPTRKINTIPLIEDGTIRRQLFAAIPSLA